ncbi:glycoside hydrolase family 2 protein [Flavobacterium hydrophilum]|uniref:Beta-glycosidase n=1 Tax=Flavobacterium hydrophilum TaxID=2211445 RepID=A0A2V4CLY5_9FLAO|nr:sugar-binding domain-containing protein [Flavobacterium hydrophilum]PXY46734.1 beta-glycosidase [Flavobacterium hydrophilum]
MSNTQKKLRFLPAVLLIFFSVTTLLAQKRMVQDISNNDWQLWLDPMAQWQNDVLYAPPANIRALPVNSPTGGWQAIEKGERKTVHLPATVEEFHWGWNKNPFGVSGNYLGISWFSTAVNVPSSMKGKRIILHFESVRFRAEVFVNQKLAGYDLINGTPFDVDITDYVTTGKSNKIDVRITDPNGNFDWRDSSNYMWGDYRTNPTHGFGGITGKVSIVATDNVFVNDIFIKNKPAINEIDAEISLTNTASEDFRGNVLLQVNERKSGKSVWEKSFSIEAVKGDNASQSFTIKVDNAKFWDVDNPNLYVLKASLKKDKEVKDIVEKKFGFRWFEVKEIDGDKQFYLNNKRIVIRTAISWGFWPVNGIAPSDELAKKQITDAKAIGLNMLNFHRTIGQTNVLDYADEMGLLYFQEPGGNQFPANQFNPKTASEKEQADFYFAARDEKFFRMIKRDRSHPSLVIYNMHNERGAEPQKKDSLQMLAGHKLDPTRIMTYNSSNGAIKMGPDPRFKLHLLPYDNQFYNYGWFDQHHAGGPGVYHDNLYSNPKKYAKYTDNKAEIVYYGEEGAIGTPPRLQLIRDEILKKGKEIGWESDDYLKWYDAYDDFLKKNDFQKSFPNVDSLTRKMGNVSFYYQGRTIENVRINNTIDGYAVNGWESMKLENHSGIVDNYRNLKGDPDLIARYNKPLYIAVKLTNKVLSVKDSTTVDFFIVNEKDIKGAFDLKVKAVNDKKETVWTKTIPVKVSGGIQYGELLSSKNTFVPQTEGYTKITADLVSKENVVIATGSDELFAVKLNKAKITSNLVVADTTGILAKYFDSEKIAYKDYKKGEPSGNCLVIGAFKPQQTGNPLVTDLLEWVNNGNTVVIVNDIDIWATYFAKKEAADYRGFKTLGTSWYGGNFFVKETKWFEGLPQSCVFNWEYQCFATYNKNRIGLRMFNGETIVGCVSDHKQEVYSALTVMPHGRGKIIFCALDIFSCIKENEVVRKAEGDGENAAMKTFNVSSKNKANILGQQLLLNLLK